MLSLLFACSAKQKEAAVEETKIKLQEVDSPTEASIRGIWVLDSNCIWMSGASGAVIRSLDAGNSWQLLPAPDHDSLDFRDIHAFSRESALIVSAGYPARVYLTENSGQNWQLVYQNSDSSAFMNSVHFKDSLNGLIVGDVLHNYHFLLRSSDGGRSWQRIDSALIPEPLQIEHAFAASGSCIAVNSNGDYVIAFGGEQSRVFREVGEKWLAVTLPVNDSAASSGIYAIASADGMLMTAGGDYSKEDQAWPAIYSTDGGASWGSTDLKYQGYRSVVDYWPAMDIWLAAGSNGVDCFIQETRRWTKISDQPINTLQFDKTSNRGWAAGPKGNIYRIQINR